MKRCYKMSMDEFMSLGLTWVVTSCFVEFKRPLVLGDVIVVATSILNVDKTGAKVGFEITKKEKGKLAANGYFEYSMINIRTGRAEKIPQTIIEKYSI